MTVVLMSSKFEDVEPVLMKTLLEKAGFNRFTRQQVVDLENDILKALGFRLHNSACHFHQASTIFKQVVAQSGGSLQSASIQKQIGEAEQLLAFFSYLVTYRPALTQPAAAVSLPYSIAKMSLQYLKRQLFLNNLSNEFSINLLSNLQEHHGAAIKR